MPKAPHTHSVLWVPESEPAAPAMCEGCGQIIDGLQWELWCVVDGFPVEQATSQGEHIVICPVCHFISG